MNKHIITSVVIIIVVMACSSAVFAQDGPTIISIPSIGVETSIEQAPLSPALGTWDVSHLDMTVGHMEMTAWFGEGGNVVLGAHSETTNGSPEIFYALNNVQVGDEIIVNDNGTLYRYQVNQSRVVNAADVSIVYPTSHEQLTLFTCQRGSYSQSSNTYSRRQVIIAERIG